MISTLTLALCLGAADPLLTDIGGTTHRPFDDESARAVVLVFVGTDCPIANAYHPELRRLEAEFGPKGFRFFLLHPDPEVTAERAAAHAREYGVTAPVVLDHDQKFVRAAGATVTPEAAVLGRDGRVLYLGRIDDRYLTWGKKRPEPTRAELKAALEAVAGGEPVAEPRTKAVGCYIPKLPND